MTTSLRALFNSTSRSYDRARRQLIPSVDEFYRAVLDSLPFERECEFKVLDLGAETGILSALIAYSFPRVGITLLDVSREMLARAEERLAAGGDRFQFAVADYEMQYIQGRYDAIVSSLSIHHLKDSSKRVLFHKIHGALDSGGVFVNADQIRGESDLVESRNRRAWLRRVRELHPAESDLYAALKRMELDHRAPIETQLEWLREAGFREVVCSYRNLIFALCSGIK